MAHVLEASYRHDQEPSVLRTREDIHRFLGELGAAGWEFTAAAVYAVDEATDENPGHELIVGVNAAAGLGGLRYAGPDGDWYSRGEHTASHPVQYVYFGTGHEFPDDSEVPLAGIEQALAELLAGGGRRPTCVAWRAGA